MVFVTKAPGREELFVLADGSALPYGLQTTTKDGRSNLLRTSEIECVRTLAESDKQVGQATFPLHVAIIR